MVNPKDLRSAKIIGGLIMAVGLVLIANGVSGKASLPPELPMGAPGWHESARERIDQDFRATGFLIGGGLLAAFGLMLIAGFSRRVQQVSTLGTEIRAEALGRGLRRGFGEGAAAGVDPEERLRKLEELHAKGLVTDDEYAEKRGEIVAEL